MVFLPGLPWRQLGSWQLSQTDVEGVSFLLPFGRPADEIESLLRSSFIPLGSVHL